MRLRKEYSCLAKNKKDGTWGTFTFASNSKKEFMKQVRNAGYMVMQKSVKTSCVFKAIMEASKQTGNTCNWEYTEEDYANDIPVYEYSSLLYLSTYRRCKIYLHRITDEGLCYVYRLPNNKKIKVKGTMHDVYLAIDKQLNKEGGEV